MQSLHLHRTDPHLTPTLSSFLQVEVLPRTEVVVLVFRWLTWLQRWLS